MVQLVMAQLVMAQPQTLAKGSLWPQTPAIGRPFDRRLGSQRPFDRRMGSQGPFTRRLMRRRESQGWVASGQVLDAQQHPG
jgi:hypothetical protein